MSIERTSHDHLVKLIGESVLQREITPQDFEGKEGEVFVVHIDEKHTVEITLDHFENVESEYIDGCNAFFSVDHDKQFPGGLYKVEPAGDGEPMALTLSPIMALSQGKLEYQVNVNRLKEDANAAVGDAPTSKEE
jgi:hypothetical protein